MVSMNAMSPFRRVPWKRQPSLRALSNEFNEGESLFNIAERALEGVRIYPVVRVAAEITAISELDNLSRDVRIDFSIHLVWTDPALVGVPLSQREGRYMLKPENYEETPLKTGQQQHPILQSERYLSAFPPPCLEIDQTLTIEAPSVVSYPDNLQDTQKGLVHQVIYYFVIFPLK